VISPYIISGTTNTPNVNDIWGNHIDSSTFASDFWVVKLNNLGDTLWTRCYGGNYGEYSESIIQTLEGGYLICGCATSLDGDVSGNNGQNDVWVVKTDSMGDIEWEKCYGGSQDDYATSAIQINDSMFVITGYTYSNNGDVHGNHGNADFWVLKINNLGDTIWTKTFGGLGDDIANSIVQTDDGQYVILGSTTSDNGICLSNHGQNDYLLIKIDSNGQLVWNKCLGGTKNDFEKKSTKPDSSLSKIQTMIKKSQDYLKHRDMDGDGLPEIFMGIASYNGEKYGSNKIKEMVKQGPEKYFETYYQIIETKQQKH